MREHEKERERERSTKCTGGSVRKKERIQEIKKEEEGKSETCKRRRTERNSKQTYE